MQNFTSFDPLPSPYGGPKPVRILFDESHSESWSISRQQAKSFNPPDPLNSSYQSAAELLSSRDCSCYRNLDQRLTPPTLANFDLLALLHPCDPQWEKTIDGGSPQLSPAEIDAIQQFVESGGSLLLITEYEHNKYGDNLNLLLSRWGIQIENNTVQDRFHSIHDNHSWILSESTNSMHANSIAHAVTEACFYQAGSCTVTGEASIVRRSYDSATPPHAGLIAVATPGKGRLVVVTDSRLFGDEFLNQFDHQTLWLNLIDWLSIPAYLRHEWKTEKREPQSTPLENLPETSASWISLKSTIHSLRVLQNPDGSVDPKNHSLVTLLLPIIIHELHQLSSFFPHQYHYWLALEEDLNYWQTQGYLKPDFKNSLEKFEPQKHRIEGIKHLALFPMYTPNGSLQIRFEAILFRTPWPTWIATLEKTRFSNPKFVPGELLDYTEGYQSDCAVLFPETVSISGKPMNTFGTIFCDREAQRLLHYTNQAVELLKISLPPRASALLTSSVLAQQSLELWDLIHDQAHSLGELPFDPFMIRQRSPYWIYSLEELRVDLRAFREADQMAKKEFPFAEYVTYAILFDRLFRFPIVGTRIRNYDALGGQLLFSSLHHQGILKWCDNQLTIDWKALPQAVATLEEEILLLYRHATESSKMSFWIESHDLISRHLRPNIASQWKKENRAINSEENPAQWLKVIQPDEFPLGQFHLNLQKKINHQKVIS